MYNLLVMLLLFKKAMSANAIMTHFNVITFTVSFSNAISILND